MLSLSPSISKNYPLKFQKSFCIIDLFHFYSQQDHKGQYRFCHQTSHRSKFQKNFDFPEEHLESVMSGFGC